MYFPKGDNIYGSEYLFLREDKKQQNGKIYHRSYKITKTHWKALDTPNKRCDDSNSEANTTQCITRYLEQMIGCSMGLLRSDRQAPR